MKIRNTTNDQDLLAFKETIQSGVDEKKIPDVGIDW